jgi:hypothetical protein
MKKLLFISNVVIINLVLIVTIVSQFNPFNLPLSELEYFNGFAIHTLFPTSVIGMFLAYFGIFSLVSINIKFFKKN